MPAPWMFTWLHLISSHLISLIHFMELAASGALEKYNVEMLAADAAVIEKAEDRKLFKEAIELAPYFVPAYVNLADLYRRMGNEEAANRLLTTALAANPKSGPLHHAMGLAQVRNQTPEKALASLGRAYELSHEDSRYAYVYAVALNSMDQSDQAVLLLQETHEKFENDQDVIFMLATIHRDRKEYEAALEYAKILIRIVPANPQVQAFVKDITDRM